MNEFAHAADDIARQVTHSMQGLRDNLDSGEEVYVYALVVPDDFSYLMGYANTVRHFAASKNRSVDKWYFAEWFAQGMELKTEALTELLGSADFHDDKEVKHDRQAAWLLAMTKGLDLARAGGALEWRSRSVVAFCSMVDCDDAIWIERETAQMVNPPTLFRAIEAELTATAWYGTPDPGPRALRSAFERLRR